MSVSIHELKDNSQTMESLLWRISACALIFRWLNAFLVQSSFVPDEYWQSLEVAHQMAFGRGHLTWEWRTALRGYTYPAMFAALFKIIESVNLDHPTLLVYLPKLLQATFSAGQDVALFQLSWKLYGMNAAKWTLFCHMTSWFGFYMATRTLTNTMESVCTTIGLLYYPWPGTVKRYSLMKCILLAALSCVMRPTAAIIWVPLSLWQLIRSNTRIIDIFCKYIPVGSAVLLASCCVDRIFCGKWVLVQWNFLEFNVLHNMAGLFGTHPWHWYITQGVPVVLGAHLLLVIPGARQRRMLPMVLLTAWVVFVYSLLSHKEFRFILPILPVCMIIAGSYISQSTQSVKKLSVLLLLVLNIPAALYMGLVHQRGTIDVMSYLRQELGSKVNPEGVLFLMPCHSTPFYSHIHTTANLRFLTCELNLESLDGYVDEAELFYQGPERWMDEFDSSSSSRYTGYIVMFDVLQKDLSTVLDDQGYQQVADFFHTHFPEGRVGSRVLVFHRSGERIPKRPQR